MAIEDDQQLKRVWDAYSDSGFRFETSAGEIVHADEFDERRRDQAAKLNQLIDRFLEGDLPLAEFKSEIDGQNKQYPLWGFKGMNGMMFFNMLYRSANNDPTVDLAALLHQVIIPPDDTDEAADKIRALVDFVEERRTAADDLRKAPRSGSIPYFLSYFWQLRAPDTYPVYYTSMIRVLSDLAIWEPRDDLAESYVDFWELNEELRSIFADYADQSIHLWDIEHAFWYWQHREDYEEDALPDDEEEPTSRPRSLPDSYIPPIVSILPDLANNTDDIQELVADTSQSVDVLYENRLAKCLQMLGFEVDELGQGSGRNPDGIAKDRQHDYAIIYDAKSRSDGYSISTNDERQFQDYIAREVPALRTEGFRNIYFAVISGSFVDEGREAIRSLKINTDIQEVRLIEAEAMLTLLEHRLRDPEFDLGPGDQAQPGVQGFFADSGILTAAEIREELGV